MDPEQLAQLLAQAEQAIDKNRAGLIQQLHYLGYLLVGESLKIAERDGHGVLPG